MQNLPIPAPIPPLPGGTGVSAIPDAPVTASASGPDSEDFSAVLERELTAKAVELKPDAALPGATASDSRPQPAESAIVPLQIPSNPNPMAPALLAVMAGSQSDERIAREPPHALGRALHAARSTATPAQRDLPPAAQSADAADFAAPGKSPPPVAAADKTSHSATAELAAQRLPEFLPPVTATDKTSHSATAEPAAQRLPDVAPLPHPSSYPSIVGAAPLASAAAPATHNLKLEVLVGAPGWNVELAQKVVWMATQQQQVAELHLNPPHLGPVEVMLTIGNDQGAPASVQFVSPHLATREAIEAALPRLRDMLADSGIALGNVTVSADSFRQQAEAGRQDGAPMQHPADITAPGAALAARPAVSLIRSGRHGLVDTFA